MSKLWEFCAKYIFLPKDNCVTRQEKLQAKQTSLPYQFIILVQQ